MSGLTLQNESVGLATELFERAFGGETVSDALSSVLTKEPDCEHLPAKFRDLIRACLEKDPKRRLQDVGDAWRLMVDAQPAPQSRSSLPWAIATAVLVVALAIAMLRMPHSTQQVVNQPAINFDLDLGGMLPSSKLGAGVVLSPDGGRVARWQVAGVHRRRVGE